jgi:SAM-dependent methyltransferase
MNAVEYDAWYDTPRGRWIGGTELRLLRRMLDPQPEEEILDVGCGTGWFTRRMAELPGLDVTGLDLNDESLRYARERDEKSAYLEADACALPFGPKCFDRVLSVTALCFIADWPLALAEIVRVTRKRFAVGLLNRTSLLWHDKGQDGGKGAYEGAHWHTIQELRLVLDRLPVRNIRIRTAILLPSGSRIAVIAEHALPSCLPLGAFLLVTGDVK